MKRTKYLQRLSIESTRADHERAWVRRVRARRDEPEAALKLYDVWEESNAGKPTKDIDELRLEFGEDSGDGLELRDGKQTYIGVFDNRIRFVSSRRKPADLYPVEERMLWPWTAANDEPPPPLCKDVAVLIARYLTPADVAHLRCVCHQWHQLFGAGEIWRDFYARVRQLLRLSDDFPAVPFIQRNEPVDTDWFKRFYETFRAPFADCVKGNGRHTKKVLSRNYEWLEMLIRAHLVDEQLQIEIRKLDLGTVDEIRGNAFSRRIRVTYQKPCWGVYLSFKDRYNWFHMILYQRKLGSDVRLLRPVGNGQWRLHRKYSRAEFFQPFDRIVCDLSTHRTTPYMQLYI